MTALNFDPKAVVAKAIAAGLVQTPAQIAEKRKAESVAKKKAYQLKYQREWKRRQKKNPIGPMFRLSTARKDKKGKT